ncbi:MAG: S-layer homology domain-containing protein [Oscillospiraceae bacterium]|nr:S-layer homology domain-containing protein [Oscillospiraceae bacterium]
MALILAFSLAVPAFAAVEDTGFSDVDANAWYAGAVIYCREHNLMAGTGNDQFAPENNLTRAQLAAVLYRIEETPAVTGTDAFTDTPDGAWYHDAVLWVSQQGLIGGYGGGLFGPNDSVTREQMATIFWRYAGSPAAGSENTFADEADIAAYAATAVDWSDSNSIVRPVSSGTFAPKSNATRAQVADALMNFDRTQQTVPTAPTKPDPTPSEGGRVLIAYFSATNNTEGIANHLDAILDAGIYEITPETPYTSADLNYNTDCRANREQNDASARPAISGSVDNMEQYDVIFLGYPIWWGQAPKIIYTFLESYDLGGKTIVPFCTSGSSGIGSSAANLYSLASGATWLDGQRFSGSTSRSAVETWVNGLGLTLTPAA